MPAPDDLYWNPLDLNPNHEDPYAAAMQTKPYIDSWDLENYAYLKQHLGSVELNSDPSSLDSPGQSLSPDINSNYYRRTDNYNRQSFCNNKYGYPVRSGQNYDLDELAEDNEKLYESFGENYGLNYHGYLQHYYTTNRFSIAEDMSSQYVYPPVHNGARRTNRQDNYLSMERVRLNPNKNRNRFAESRYDPHLSYANGGVYAKAEVGAGPKRRYSEQPRTDFGRMQAEKQKLQLLIQPEMKNMTVRRRVSASGRLLPEVTPLVMEEMADVTEEFGSDLEDSFEPEESMLPIYNTGNRRTMADIHRMNKIGRNSISYGEYDYDLYHPLSRPCVMPHPIYGRLESVYGFPLGVGGISPLYDDIRTVAMGPATPKPDHFTLGNYGHLQIDYSCNWTHLNRYIKA